jgi:hypothetical protein
MVTTTIREELEALERDYLKRKAEIRADDSLCWEKKELAVRRLGLEYGKACKEVEGGGRE